MLNLAGRVYRYRELIEEIIAGPSPLIDLTISSDGERNNSGQRGTISEVIDLTYGSENSDELSARDVTAEQCSSSSSCYPSVGVSPRYEPSD